MYSVLSVASRSSLRLYCTIYTHWCPLGHSLPHRSLALITTTYNLTQAPKLNENATCSAQPPSIPLMISFPLNS